MRIVMTNVFKCTSGKHSHHPSSPVLLLVGWETMQCIVSCRHFFSILLSTFSCTQSTPTTKIMSFQATLMTCCAPRDFAWVVGLSGPKTWKCRRRVALVCSRKLTDRSRFEHRRDSLANHTRSPSLSWMKECDQFTGLLQVIWGAIRLIFRREIDVIVSFASSY